VLGYQAQQSLQVAAEEVLARIRRDRDRVDQRLRPLLEHIESHLFDPGLDVNQLKRRCGVRDNSVPIQFHAQLGLPPHAYMEECRLKTGCRLLEDTDLKVWQIADLLGYSSIQVFSRAFSRWSGMRPTVYRKRHRRKAAGVARDSGLGASSGQLEIESLRRALTGELEAAEAQLLIKRLVSLYPGSAEKLAAAAAAPGPRAAAVRQKKPAGGESLSLLGREDVERVRAEAVWSLIKDLPFAEQRRAVAEKLRFSTPALFELLGEHCLIAGRADRRRGIELAELALAALEATDCPAVDHSSLQARGWAWLANARRLALDFSGAEQALSVAEELVPPAEEAPLAYAELLQKKAALRSDQRRFEEANALLDRALPLLLESGGKRQLARAMLLRANVVYEIEGAEASIRDFQHAAELLEDQEDAYLSLAAYQGLADVYVRSGKYREAAAILPRFEAIQERSPSRILGLYLLWLKGLMAQAGGQHEIAEGMLEAVRDGFIRANWLAVSVLAGLDLALLYSEQGQSFQASRVAAEILPLLDTLKMRDETMVALGIFRRAVQAGTITAEVLRQMRAASEHLRGERPTRPSA